MFSDHGGGDELSNLLNRVCSSTLCKLSSVLLPPPTIDRTMLIGWIPIRFTPVAVKKTPAAAEQEMLDRFRHGNPHKVPFVT